MANDVSLVTAYRYFTNRPETGFGWSIHKMCHVLGYIPSMKSDEGQPKYDPDSLKVRAVYTGIHTSYSMLMTLPVPFLYASQILSSVYIAAILGYCVWNGGASNSCKVLCAKQISGTSKTKFVTHGDQIPSKVKAMVLFWDNDVVVGQPPLANITLDFKEKKG